MYLGFVAQTLSIDFSGYDGIEVIYIGHCYVGYNHLLSSGYIPISNTYGCQLTDINMVLDNDNESVSEIYLLTRRFTIGNNALTFEEEQCWKVLQASYVVTNGCTPVMIFGIKSN